MHVNLVRPPDVRQSAAAGDWRSAARHNAIQGESERESEHQNKMRKIMFEKFEFQLKTWKYVDSVRSAP
jgi:hypothetical protein